MLIDVKAEVFPLKKVFTISRGSRSFAEVVTVKITKDGFSGFGECVPYQRYNETVQSVINQINTVNDFSKLIEIDKHLLLALQETQLIALSGTGKQKLNQQQ